MPAQDRPRRSVLYMPGANARAQDKARSLAADGLIFDLEDAVAPEAKDAARDQVHCSLREGGYGQRECIVRVNGLETAWGAADLAMACCSGAHAILLPKVESAAQVEQAVAGMESGGAPETMELWCMMETPRGILHAEEIAAASPRLGCLVMGTSDLVNDLRARHTRERLPLLASLSWCVLAARAHHLAVLDGVHLDLHDDEGLALACQQGVEMGFDGKTLIHPRQVDIANRAFAPTPQEVTRARAVIAAFEAALAQGKGVAVLEGRLVESLHVRNAQRVLRVAEAIAAAAPGA